MRTRRSAIATMRSRRSHPPSKARPATIPIAFARERATASRACDRDADHFSDFFDNLALFVLDIRNFSTIIYIWYEGGERKPPLVRLTFNLALSHLDHQERRGRCHSGGGRRIPSERARRQPRIGHRVARAKTNPDEGGDKASWQRKPRALRRRRRRSGNSFSRTKKRGRPSPPFQFSAAARPPQSVVPSHTRTRRITSHCSILSTTSMPDMTRPNTV